MSLTRATPARMDLAAFRLGEVEEARPGVFRHERSLKAAMARIFPPKPPPAAEAEPDHFVWHSLDELLDRQP
jgi:hypothetical protein